MDLIDGVGTLNAPPGWQHAGHEHAGIEVVGVLQGRLAFAATGGIWYANANQVLVVPPHLPHRPFTDSGAGLIWIHVTHVPRDLADRLVPGRQPRVITLPASQFAEYSVVFGRLSAIGNKAAPEPEQVRLLRAYLDVFLLILAQGVQEQDPATAAMREAAAYLQAHLDENVSVAGLAGLYFMSETTFRRRFRAVFGMAPKQYLLEVRLEEARDLLATSRLSLQEVAKRTGFYDLGHFSSSFRRRFGLSPSAWRVSSQT